MTQQTPNKALTAVATRLAMSEQDLQNVIINTVMPSGKQVTAEQFNTFIAVANEYKLNPLTKEVYAFPTQGGGIQPIVSIDGWLKIINTHPDFNGMTFEDHRDDSGNLSAITCNIHKKGIEHPVQVTEYMAECAMGTQPWKKYPSRMLRHKAAIQAGRYAFGLSGIIDPDEADRYKEAGVIEPNGGAVIDNEPAHCDQAFFDQNKSVWAQMIVDGKKTIITMTEFLAKKGRELSEEQIEELKTLVSELAGANDE